jgi:hypothetical protein
MATTITTIMMLTLLLPAAATTPVSWSYMPPSPVATIKTHKKDITKTALPPPTAKVCL